MTSSGIRALDHVALALAQRDTRKQLWREQVGKPTGFQPFTQQEMNDRLIYGLTVAQLFNVDNVRDWLISLRMNGPEAFKLMTDLPCCLPPYPFTYMEWDDEGVRCSAYLITGDMDHAGNKRCSLTLFDTTEDLKTTYFLGALGISLDEQGKVVPSPTDPAMPRIEVMIDQTLRNAATSDPEMYETVQNQLARACVMALFANSLLHCKNVKEVIVDPRDSMSRQQIREAERKHRRLVVHKVLEVNPLRKYRVRADEVEGVPTTKRLHHVRGHFAEYGPDYGRGLLFGRIAGRFFIPPHVRGDLPTGVVDKTYALAPKVVAP